MLSEIDHTRMLSWHCSENYGYKSFAMDENCRCNSSLGLVGEAGVYLGAAIFDCHEFARVEFCTRCHIAPYRAS